MPWEPFASPQHANPTGELGSCDVSRAAHQVSCFPASALFGGDCLHRDEVLKSISRRQFQTLDLRGHHVGLDFETELRETLMHLLQARKILFANGEAVAEHALDVALTMQFGVASTEAKWETNPTDGIPFGKECIVFLLKETG